MGFQVICLLAAFMCLPLVVNAQTGDCSTLIGYTGQNTAQGTAVSSASSISSCIALCLLDASCLSFHWDSANAAQMCYHQQSSPQAYARFVLSTSKNYERPCKIPDSGCSYSVAANTMGGGTSSLVAGVSQIQDCHAQCVSNLNCLAWQWKAQTLDSGVTSRCSHFTTLGATSPSVDNFYFVLTCVRPVNPPTVPSTNCGFQPMPNIHAFGGTEVPASNLIDCLNQCQPTTCAGVDWTDSTTQCFTHTAATVNVRGPLPGTTLWVKICV